MTQVEQVLKHLQSGKTLTSMQAFRLYDITLVKDRVRDLRNRGFDIKGRRLHLRSRRYCMQYSL
jgi:hypothetical protein